MARNTKPRVTCLAVIFMLLGHALACGQVVAQPGEDDAAPATGIIEAEKGAAPSDSEIKARLNSIYANLDELKNVVVGVDDGVIVLGGTVDDLESMERAKNLAERVAGAVIVVNNISRDRTLGARMKSATQGIATGFKDLVGAAPLLLLALAVVGLAVFLARVLGRAERLYQRVSDNWFVRDLIRQVVQGVVVFTGVVLALQLLDATALLGSVVGALGIIGLAIGFATRETVENYIASILLSIRQPFRRDEHIDVDGIEGKVLRLTPRATVLMSLEGNHLRIPNSKVFKATITNYTRNPLRRFEFTVGVDTDLDLNKPRALAIQTLGELPGVLQSPPPQCLVDALGDSNVVLKVQAWIDQRETDYVKVKSEAQRLVKEAFDDANIVMPEPIYNIKLRRTQPPARRDSGQVEAPAVPPEDQPGDTTRDSALEAQMKEEQNQHGEEDLLKDSAPTE